MFSKEQFKERWMWPISSTYDVNILLPDMIQSFKKVVDDLYFSRARKFAFTEKLLNKLRAVFDLTTDEENKFWNHPVTKVLFKIWLENIHGVKRGWMAYSRERSEFFRYMMDNLKVVHDPKYSQAFENYQNMVFGMKILRPNPQAHIYLSFNFVIRPMKKFIQDYFRMAVISGNYEMLMKRFPPYHFMLKLNAFPGERTFVDARGMDFPPITFRLDLKFTTPISLNKVQTRSNDRFITCPVKIDPYLEAEKKAEVDKLEAELAKTPFDYFSKVEYGEDGKIYYIGGKSGKEEIVMFGPRRANWIASKDLLNLIKAIPRPSSESGLIIRFNLLSPVTVLIEGINRKRDITFEEVFTVWKALDILEMEIRKPENERKTLAEVINEVLTNPNPIGVKRTTIDFINDINRLREENIHDPSEDVAWCFLIDRLNEGKGRNILQAICNRLIADGFDLVFSLWPLLTGNEIRLTDSGVLEIKSESGTKKYHLPLLEYLKREIEDLLKQVFTKHLDISGATTRIRSEPILAGMIVEHCLNIKSNTEKFRNILKNHLNLHYNFIKEYVSSGGEAPEFVKDIYENNFDMNEQIQKDVEDILLLIEKTRNRLSSPGIANRLLCFIDPKSIVVQIGEFTYDGIKEEEQFAILKKPIDFFEKAGFSKVKQPPKDLLLLFDGENHIAGIVSFFSKENQIDISEGSLKYYLVFNDEPPSANYLQVLRRKLHCEVIPILSSRIDNTLSLRSNEAVIRELKEIEDSFLTRLDPYDESKPIIDQTWFYGRKDYMKRLPSILSQGQHVGVFGLRKVGKTSLIQQIRHRFVTTPTAYIDCQSASASPKADFFFEEIFSQIYHQLRIQNLKELPSELPIGNAHDFKKNIITLFTIWKQNGRYEPFLIILDEIDKIFPNREQKDSNEILSEYVNFFKVIRGMAQNDHSLVTLVVSYRPDVNRYNLISPLIGENPMFKAFREEYLGFLTENESLVMVHEIGGWKDIKWDEDAARKVYYYCGGHPLVTRYFASKACDEGKLKQISYSKTIQTADEIRNTFYENNIWNYYHEGIWAYLRENEKFLLREIVLYQNEELPVNLVHNEIKGALANLVHFGIVAVKNKKIVITACLFSDWVKQHINA